MSENIKWSQFFLPNTALYDVKLPDSVVNRLWGYIHKSRNRCNDILAGNISESYDLIDEDNYLFNKVLKPISLKYVSENSIVNNFRRNNTYSELYLKKLWVNYQYKNEFNPLHTHGGVLSFVIWIKIPTNAEEQHNLPIAKNSNCPSASDFQFVYTDILGNIQRYPIQLSTQDNGLMMIFPANLNHQVYPFYDCDENRVSISGNICWS